MSKLKRVSKDIFIKGLALFLKQPDAIVLGDLHIGYEETLNRQGMLVPRFAFKDIVSQLRQILTRRFKLIIVNGDLKHSFGWMPAQELAETKKIMAIFQAHSERLIMIKGNHDASLQGIELLPHFSTEGFYFTHGHRLDKQIEGAHTIIIGHEHPAITLREGIRTESYKVFLFGKYKKKRLIVLPSFNPLIPGTNILNKKFLSPYLNQDISDFEVFIVQDKVYEFGRIKELKDVV